MFPLQFESNRAHPGQESLLSPFGFPSNCRRLTGFSPAEIIIFSILFNPSAPSGWQIWLAVPETLFLVCFRADYFHNQVPGVCSVHGKTDLVDSDLITLFLEIIELQAGLKVRSSLAAG